MSNTEVTIIVLALSFVIIALTTYFTFGRKRNTEDHH